MDDQLKVGFGNENKADYSKGELQSSVRMKQYSSSSVRKVKRYRFKKGVIPKTLIVLGFAGVVGYNIAQVKDPVQVLNHELQIHSYRYEVEGDLLSPNTSHECAIGGPEEGSIGERITRYASEHHIPLDDLQKAVSKNGTSILDADQIVVREDGSYQYVVEEPTIKK